MDLSQDIQRKAAIKAVKLEHKSASAKRVVSTNFHYRIKLDRFFTQIGYLMQSANLIEDIFATWDKITKAALVNGSDVVTTDNISEVNAAIVKQAK